MSEVNFEDLLGTGAHFGHVTRKWNPKYKPYILLEKNGVHIIDLECTIKAIQKATTFIQDIISKKGEILFVGTKPQSKDIVQQEADRCSMFYIVERWLGGTLTNFSTIKQSIKRLKMLEKEGSLLYDNLTKKETQMLNRERVKLADQHRGIKDMRRLPDAIVVSSANYEDTAIREAKRLEIPVIGIVDSNTDPTMIAHPIPANDDSIRTVQLILAVLADAVIESRTSVEEKKNKVNENGSEDSSPKTAEISVEESTESPDNATPPDEPKIPDDSEVASDESTEEEE